MPSAHANLTIKGLEATPAQIAALRAICNAFIPSVPHHEDPDGYWSRRAEDLHIAEQIIALMGAQPEAQQRSFAELLDLLASPRLGLSWLGPLKSADQLAEAQCAELLRTWRDSPLPALRQAYATLKKLSTYLYFGHAERGERNPNWAAIGYPGPQPAPAAGQSALRNERLKAPALLRCDVVVIGSGSGGGVAASVLAQRGLEVIVLEKGPSLGEQDMDDREVAMTQRLYERGGLMSSVDGAVAILAGSTVGGGSTVNWSAAFRTPDYVLDEWAKAHGNPQFADPAYQAYFERIEARCQIGTALSQHNPQNKALFDGASRLGYVGQPIARNVAPPREGADPQRYWQSQGYGGLGDRYGHKQGTAKTFLADALAAGAKLYADCTVDYITHAYGKADGVVAWQRDAQGQAHRLTIKCDKIVLAAGALHSPALLWRSGLRHPHIGQHLYLHPTNAVAGHYAQPVDAWHGPMMSAVVDDFTRLDGNYGYKLETPPIHSGFMALATPWDSGEQFKRDMRQTRHIGAFIAITRDRFGGHLSLDSQGLPQVHYRLNHYDRAHLIHGMKEAAKIHMAAGATGLRLLHHQRVYFDAAKGRLADFLEQIERLSWAPNRFTLFSAHQMGTCRMGGDAKRHPFRPNGESRELAGLFVADASAFPTCSGANPMLSIMALAHYVAEQV